MGIWAKEEKKKAKRDDKGSKKGRGGAEQAQKEVVAKHWKEELWVHSVLVQMNRNNFS